MEIRPGCLDKVIELIEKGVDIPNPLTLDIGDDVRVEQISGHSVKIYPGCRIYGSKTVISEGAQLGHEGPATIENCRIGSGVRLEGGYFREAVFLEGASMGLGAHVREGCLLEEEANGAHCVGLKQTILFPFVTLGSLINFCDCLMAGGTSRKNHSEVGSSYIHFNFTPEGDKTTASLIGDVPRGVMLNQPPIFLGGQGGMVGPLRMGYGNVVAAGGIIRKDATEDNRLIVCKPGRGAVLDFRPGVYPGLSRIVKNNLLYLANLLALEQWYLHVRRPFFDDIEFGPFICEGAIENLSVATTERIKRLKTMAGNMSVSGTTGPTGKDSPRSQKEEFRENIQQICEIFVRDTAEKAAPEARDRFIEAFSEHSAREEKGYIECVKALPTSLSEQGTQWLAQIVLSLMTRASTVLGSFRLDRQ